jgi:Na+/phosphate symporter
MTKDIVLKMLEDNKDNIMTSFKVSEEGIDNIKEIIDKRYANLEEAMESVFASDLNDREKMASYYLIGHVNGIIRVLESVPQ